MSAVLNIYIDIRKYVLFFCSNKLDPYKTMAFAYNMSGPGRPPGALAREHEADLEREVSTKVVTTGCTNVTLALVWAHGDQCPASAKRGLAADGLRRPRPHDARLGCEP